MASLGRIVEQPRERVGECSGNEAGRDSIHRKGMRLMGSRKRRSSCGSDRSAKGSPPSQHPAGGRENGGGRRRRSYGREQDVLSPQEDHRSRFYEHYRKESEEYDEEFLTKYDEDLNTTLIFAGLFSAITSAFIIEVHSHLQPDPNDETAALLRVLLYKIDNTTFGGHTPALPQWNGPPHTIIHVQAILFTSLAISLLSAFLAMLGKQWLNQYASTDMRGTAIERSQNRQRKLDGIIIWYFNHVMESLPLMLQIALLLLGCALSRYLWGIDITLGSVILGATSSGMAFYIFIVVAGAVSESCPYQTPGSHALRYLRPRAKNMLRTTASVVVSVSKGVLGKSKAVKTVASNLAWYRPWWSGDNIRPFLKDMILEIPHALVIDAYRLLGVMIWPLAALPVGVYRLGCTIFASLMSLGRRAHDRRQGTSRTPGQGLDEQATVQTPGQGLDEQATVALDLRCISWMIRTSSDKAVHLSTLKHLATMIPLADFDPTLVADCFDTWISCIKMNINNRGVMIMDGLEELATVSALCFFNTTSHLLVVDPTSSVLEDVRQRYLKVFPAHDRLHGHQTYHTINAAGCLLIRRWERQSFRWGDYNPSGAHEHTIVAHNLAKLAWAEYRRTNPAKVSRLLLRFALHSLSLDPPPETSVVIDCLSIIAIDLGCDIPNPGTTISDESVQVREISDMITQKIETMAETGDPDELHFKSKAITAFFPYAIWQEKDGDPTMLDAFMRASWASGLLYFTWHRADRFVSALLSEATPRAIVLSSPHIPWYLLTDRGDLVGLWAAATSAIPYTEEVAQCVVDTLLQIASRSKLLPYITPDIWAWLTTRPSLPPVCVGRYYGTYGHVAEAIRKLEDVDILKSYMLLAWSEWDALWNEGFDQICASIRGDFGGAGMDRHWVELIQRLDHVLGELAQGLGHLQKRNPILRAYDFQLMDDQYKRLRETLLEANMEAITGSRATFMCSLPLL